MSDPFRRSARKAAKNHAPAGRLAPFHVCPYCTQTFSRWGTSLIEPCPLCRRPLHRAFRWQRPNELAILLGTINTIQGIGSILAIALFVTGTISMRRLCGWIALALFVAATSYMTDGALAWRTRISRNNGQITTGRAARITGIVTAAFGSCSMLLSLVGIMYLSAGPR